MKPDARLIRLADRIHALEERVALQGQMIERLSAMAVEFGNFMKEVAAIVKKND